MTISCICPQLDDLLAQVQRVQVLDDDNFSLN